jgi:hypothetical protein
VDYSLASDTQNNYNIKDVAQSIMNGPVFDILIVGIMIHDLVIEGANTYTSLDVPSVYPGHLDADLQTLAAAIQQRGKGSLVLVGGPAEFWSFPARYDRMCMRARNVLRNAGVQVVPTETAAYIFNQMSLSRDALHFANVDNEKELFAKAWAAWLYACATDNTWGRAIEDEDSLPQENNFGGAQVGARTRSRSPPHTNQFMSFGEKGKGSSKGAASGEEKMLHNELQALMRTSGFTS